MPIVLVLVLIVHVVTAVFWAGSSFTLARTDGSGSERLFRPQMGSATVAALSGLYLWHMLHRGGFGTAEQLLAIGVVCAVAAAGIQGAMVGASLRKRRAGLLDPAVAAARILKGQRFAAGLLATTLVLMVAARYA